MAHIVSTSPSPIPGQADQQAAVETTAFINVLIHRPTDPVATSFQNLWNGPIPPTSQRVDNFFAKTPPYTSCTFASYLTGVVNAAKQPVSPGNSQAVYSLKTAASLLGGKWASVFSDIMATQLTCSAQGGVLDIQAELDLKTLPGPSGPALRFFASLFDVQQLKVQVDFNYSSGGGASTGHTRLSISLDQLRIPLDRSAGLTVKGPKVTIDLDPKNKFVVFSVSGSTRFTILGKVFEADVTMLIDNAEAEFGVSITGGNGPLLSLPLMKGVHIKEIGVGIGLVFEPPGLAVGLEGSLYIGETDTGEEKFAVVCEMEGEDINPLYVSFSADHLQLTDALTMFTDEAAPFDVPVSFSGVNFKWVENPKGSVALPDGTLPSMNDSFSATANILSFSFHGDVEGIPGKGLHGDIEMAPLKLGSIFSMGGDGTGYSVKTLSNGQPIQNDQLAKTADQQQALRTSTVKQLVPPGGPILKFQTSAPRSLLVNAHVSLFELFNVQLAANFTKTSIQFDLAFHTPTENIQMTCDMVNKENLSASFACGIDDTISLPTIGGVHLGSIHLQAMFAAFFSINTTPSGVVLQAGGSFSFGGMPRKLGTYKITVPIPTISALKKDIIRQIESEAAALFGDLLITAAAWAAKVKQGIIQSADSVALCLQRAFNHTSDEAASIMQTVGYSANEVAQQLKHIVDPSQVAKSLKAGFGLSEDAVAKAMQQVGFSGGEVTTALRDACGSDSKAISSALKGAYGWTADQIKGALRSAGFADQEIGHAFQSLGGDFAKAGDDIFKNDIPHAVTGTVNQVGNAATQAGRTISQAGSTAANDLAKGFKSIGSIF